MMRAGGVLLERVRGPLSPKQAPILKKERRDVRPPGMSRAGPFRFLFPISSVSGKMSRGIGKKFCSSRRKQSAMRGSASSRTHGLGGSGMRAGGAALCRGRGTRAGCRSAGGANAAMLRGDGVRGGATVRMTGLDGVLQGAGMSGADFGPPAARFRMNRIGIRYDNRGAGGPGAGHAGGPGRAGGHVHEVLS